MLGIVRTLYSRLAYKNRSNTTLNKTIQMKPRTVKLCYLHVHGTTYHAPKSLLNQEKYKERCGREQYKPCLLLITHITWK